MARNVVVIESLTRDKIMIPVKIADPAVLKRLEAAGIIRDGLMIFGDMVDVDGKVPLRPDGTPGVRDERWQPNPVRTLAATDYQALDDLSRLLLDDQVAQKRLRRTEQAI